MGIVLTAGNQTKVSFGDQNSGDNGAGTGEDLLAEVSEMVGWLAQLEENAVLLNFLADVSGDDIGVVVTFPQVVVLTLGRQVCQIECLGGVGFDHFFVRIQSKEKPVESGDVIFGFHFQIFPSVGEQGFQHFSVGQDIDFLLQGISQLLALEKCVTCKEERGDHDYQRKQTDLSEGGVDVLWFFKHGWLGEGLRIAFEFVLLVVVAVFEISF